MKNLLIKNRTYYKCEYTSPVGKIVLASDGEFLIGLSIAGQNCILDKLTGEVKLNENLNIFKQTKSWLNGYFNGQKPSISELKIKIVQSQFATVVLNQLIKIPYGETVSYGYIAKAVAKILGKPKMSAQAVGGAVGANPIAIIIPCHRVIGANGNLTGYSGGIDIKIKLLTHEGVSINNFFIK